MASLGFGLGARDASVLAGVLALTAGLAWSFLGRLAAGGRSAVRRRQRPPAVRPDRAGALLMVAVLAAVAVQEEVLFRGYATVNLLPRFGWGWPPPLRSSCSPRCTC